MADVPETRISILSAISNDSDNVRWAEFVRRYETPMRVYLHTRFPSLEPEDVMQETLAALVKALPNYHYTPDEKGHFRNYLIGILHHKACDMLRRRAKESEKRQDFKEDSRRTVDLSGRNDEAEEAEFREALMNAAIEQLLSDESLNPTHREIFRHAAVNHEPREQVAADFGTTRNNIDQIINRMIRRLQGAVEAMSCQAE